MPLFEELRSSGKHPRTEVLRLQAARPNPTAATALGLEPQTSLTYLERLRYADERPLAILRSWLPPRFNDVAAADFADHGLYEVLGWIGLFIAITIDSIAGG